MNRYFLKYDDKGWKEVSESEYQAVFEITMCRTVRSTRITPASFFHSENGNSVSGRVLNSWQTSAYSWDKEFMRLVGRGE